MVKLRTALKNKVNNLCSAHGVNLNRESLASEKGLNLELKIFINRIGSLNRSIAELEETIGQEGQKLKGHKNLTSIKGIGGLSAGILLSIIGDIGEPRHDNRRLRLRYAQRGFAPAPAALFLMERGKQNLRFRTSE
jgi:transposase